MPVDERRLITLDVFTERRYGGNPLAILPAADGLDDATMQRIAAEINLSETVFIHRSADDVPLLRIFTPKSELPFAGHPTVGTAVYLADELRLRDGATLTMRTRSGLVDARIRRTEGETTAAEITAPRKPECRPAPSAALCAAAISLAEDDLAHPPRVCDAGNPFTVITLASRQALSRAVLDASAWRDDVSETDAPKLFIVYIEDNGGVRTIHARMFAPSIGIAEDPATGSAAVALPALLHEMYGLPDGEHRWDVHQGVDMGRPALMHLRATVHEGVVASAHVGGAAIRVIEGTMRADR